MSLSWHNLLHVSEDVDGLMLATPAIEVHYDDSSREVTVMVTSSQNEVESVTVMKAGQRSDQVHFCLEGHVHRQRTRSRAREADLRPLSPMSRNRSIIMNDRLGSPAGSALRRTYSFESSPSTTSKVSGTVSSKTSDHRQTVDSAARDQPPDDYRPTQWLRARSAITILEDRQSLPPRSPSFRLSFGARMKRHISTLN